MPLSFRDRFKGSEVLISCRRSNKDFNFSRPLNSLEEYFEPPAFQQGGVNLNTLLK
jgi:hypothetical protein